MDMNYFEIPQELHLTVAAMKKDGYSDFRFCRKHGLMCISRFEHWYAIFTGIDTDGFENTFFYYTLDAVRRSFSDWEKCHFVGEPLGFHTSYIEEKINKVIEKNQGNVFLF